MRIPATARIEDCTSTDTTREQIAHPHLDLSDPKEPRLWATNGHVLVGIKPEVEDGDAAGYVPRESIKLARLRDKSRHTRGTPTQIALKKDSAEFAVGGARAQMPRQNGLTFPDVRQVLKSYVVGENGAVRVTFNPELLAAVVRAVGKIGSPSVSLEFRTDARGMAVGGDPIRVIVHSSVVEHDIMLMPMRTHK